MSSIPPDIEGTHSPRGDSDDLDRSPRPHEYIRRSEFIALADDVKAIKRAIIGGNSYDPSDKSLSMRVRDHDQSIRFAHRLSWVALLGMLGMLGKMIASAVAGTHRP